MKRRTGEADGDRSGPTVSVLLVDDEPGFANTARRFLEREDERFSVTTVTSASEGLERLEDVDCIVSDYEMPGRDGIQFLEEVRAEYPDLPFVLFTGKGSEEVASDAISAGVTDYLQKDTSTEQYELLANRIENVVGANRSRRALTERTRRLETLISNLPGVVYRCGNDPGWPMEDVEGEVEALTGYTAEALECGDVRWGEEIIHPDDREPIWEAVQEGLSVDGTFEVTYRIVTDDETTRWTWERGQGIYSDGGELEALEGFITDITGRKRREGILTALHDMAVELAARDTAAGICEHTIEASETILEFDLSVIDLEENGMLSKAAISEDVQLEETATMSVEEGIAGRTYRTGEAILIGDVEDVDEAKPQGPFRSAVSIPIGDHGVFQAVAEEPGAFDRTDLELAELLVSHTTSALDRLEREREVQRQNERLDRFASIVSHDLRNPLTVAKGRLELVEEECDSDHVPVLADALTRMNTIVEDTLTLARQGRTVDDPELIALGDLVEGCWDGVATASATVELVDEAEVRGDPGRVRSVFENLFRNAVEHGGDAVTVRVGVHDGGLYVEDDGTGIPDGGRDRVFEAGHTTTEEGTGFGLSIVREIVQAHGWTITVTDGEAGGARFEITGVEFGGS